MQVLIFLLALNEDLRKSSQRRDRSFVLPGKGLSLVCPHGQVCLLPGDDAHTCPRWHLPAAHPEISSCTRGTWSDGGQQWPNLLMDSPKDTEPWPGHPILLNITPFCLLYGWRLLQEHAVFVCTPARGRRMLIIRCWRNWLRIRDLCQPPLLSQNLRQRCLGAFLNHSFCHKKEAAKSKPKQSAN